MAINRDYTGLSDMYYKLASIGEIKSFTPKLSPNPSNYVYKGPNTPNFDNVFNSFGCKEIYAEKSYEKNGITIT